MQNPTDDESRSLPEIRGRVTSASDGPNDDTAQPSPTSGFQSLLDLEHELQAATEVSLGVATGRHAVETNRILRHQLSQLAANVALLEQRYEPRGPADFVDWRDVSRPPARPRPVASPDQSNLLPELITRHTHLLAKIGELIGSKPDGQRGELILAEVGRAHQAMTGVLMALHEEDGQATTGTPV